MKNKKLLFFILLSISVLENVWADNEYKIKEAENCCIVREGIRFTPSQIKVLYESDSVCFYRNSLLILQNKLTGKPWHKTKLYGSYCVKDLVKDLPEKSNVIAYTLRSYLRHMFFSTKEITPPAQGEKNFSSSDDSLHLAWSIPYTICSFYEKDISYYSNFLPDSCLEVTLDAGKSICTVKNNSSYDIFIDILTQYENKFMSVFSSDRDWEPDLYVLKGKEISFFIELPETSKQKFTVLCSEVPIPLNEIMRLYRPETYQNQQNELKIKIALKKF